MPPPAPRGGGQRKKRMTSYRQSSRSVTPSVAATPTPVPQPILPPTSATQPTAQTTQTTSKAAKNSELAKRYKCKECPPDEADIQVDDAGLIVCVNCGSIISNNNQLQNEVSFGENAQGAAVVQGTTLQEGQRRTHIQGLGHRGAEAPDADTRLHHATQQGKELIDLWGRDMYIGQEPAKIINRAVNLYSLAKLHAFQRPVPENAAIALYTACREVPDNEVLLIDLAERISVNVFELGAAYKKFLERIGLTQKYAGKDTTFQRMVEPEPLIQRFAKRLEFGNDCKKVATDACSILARMRRDWMVEGRQPMGLVGACLIIAARMNNYRRTLREVVYVVRAGEMTILKRLNEFSTTAAARLTVDQFRQLNEDELLNASLKQALPPSLSHPRRKRQKKTHDYESLASSRQSSLAPSEVCLSGI
jgi:transcription factor IIIB subunit 2